jgi:hypothetical protein
MPMSPMEYQPPSARRPVLCPSQKSLVLMTRHCLFYHWSPPRGRPINARFKYRVGKRISTFMLTYDNSNLPSSLTAPRCPLTGAGAHTFVSFDSELLMCILQGLKTRYPRG